MKKYVKASLEKDVTGYIADTLSREAYHELDRLVDDMMDAAEIEMAPECNLYYNYAIFPLDDDIIAKEFEYPAHMFYAKVMIDSYNGRGSKNYDQSMLSIVIAVYDDGEVVVEPHDISDLKAMTLGNLKKAIKFQCGNFHQYSDRDNRTIKQGGRR